MPSYQSINCLVFLFYWLLYWDYFKVIHALEKKYDNKNFVLTFFSKKIWILQTEKKVKKDVVKYPRSWLKNNLRSYDFNKIKYYQILAIYEDPDLFEYAVNELSRGLEMVDAIVSPEVRGLHLAGAIAYKLKKPLYTIRKKDRLPGEVDTITYDTPHSSDVLEFSKDCKIRGKHIAIIDDCIASGATARASTDLVQKAGAAVVQIRAMVNHTYCLDSEQRIEYDNNLGFFTHTLFDL